ncbi:MAG: hypothetical protein HY286_01260 [Planctomycetes bacterium]|nr:hypothetical protein [Planctomycetota bacterium]
MIQSLRNVFASIVIFAIPSLNSGPSSPGQDDAKLAEEAVAWFEKQPASIQNKILDAIVKDPSASATPWLASVRAVATRGAAQKMKEFKIQSKNSPDGSFPLAGELPFPLRKEYIFGARTIRPTDTNKKAPVAPVDQLQACFGGIPPDLDLALAQLLVDLDNDPSQDEFALFLESWRNGDESFYRALDRTAGTPKEVFYYDAMLGQFNQKFLKGEDFTKKKPAMKDLKRAHDYLHDGFLTYRQYRAMREAAALALLLPPHAKLPKNLARYEQKPEGQYSLKDVLQMLLVVSKYDFTEVVKLMLTMTPAMPSSIWEAKYEPLQPFMDMFTKKVPEYNDRQDLGSPEVLLKKYKDVRAESVMKIREATRRALGANGCPAFAAHGASAK